MTQHARLSPNTDAMAEFLEHAFGGDLDGLHNGLIEIACCANQGDKSKERWFSHLFGTDEIDEAVEFAGAQNAAHNNVYFAPALRASGHPRDQRGTKASVIGTLLLWSEWDDAESFAAARQKMAFAPPTAGLITGMIPGRRAQAFWRLESAIKNQDDIDSALNGMCAALGGDPKVVHADCLMRLPGSVSWRKLNKPERVDEMTQLTIKPIPPYAIEQIINIYPPAAKVGSGASYPAPVVITRGGLGLYSVVADGREAYMRNTILACLIEFCGVNGAAPTAEELFQAAWPQYAVNVDFSRPGRGEAEFRMKCKYTAQRFLTGRIPGLPSLGTAVARYREKKPADLAEPRLATDDQADEPFSASSLHGIPPARQWLVEDWLPVGHVTSLYGDGGTGKSLLALQLANSMATGQPWLGLDVPQGRVLAVFAEDDRDEIWRRQYSILRQCGHAMVRGLDDLYLWPRVGYDNLLQLFEAKKMINVLTPFYDKLRQRIDRIRPGLVILDTAADIFGGEENVRMQVNHFIKATLGSLCVSYNCTVLMLAQPSLSGSNTGTGTAGSTAWNNSVRSRWYLTKPEAGSSDERVLTRMKANYAAAGQDQKIDLLWDDGVFKVNAAGKQVITGSRANEILDGIQAAFDEGNPFGHASQSARPVIPWMMETFLLKRETCKEWVAAWVSNGVVRSQRCTRGSRKEGLTVAKRPGDL